MNATTAKTKILVIVGPTASGKSELAVNLALKYNGEVVSADSRQVYKELDIGTGKITAEEMRGVPHHCLDIADPHDRFTAMHWKKAAEAAVKDIASRGKLPIVCGGTGFYISALVDDLGFPDVEADTEEQKALEAKPAEELFEELKKLDPERAATIDLKNKRRLSRAILITRELGKVPVLARTESAYEPIMVGISLSSTELKKRIRARLMQRFEAGMIEEAKRLHAAPPEGMGISYERMDELGLEYRFLAMYLQNTMSFEVLIDTLYIKIGQYAKRQKTWFKKDTRIRWIEGANAEAITSQIVL
ncbi:MAG: miaA [Candidatus Parcubacteria bacterium]|nr:miaA [Candidatus Parcubacteria bacterium]